jgi:hypothetical protein
MKRISARRHSVNDIDLNINPHQPLLFIRKDEKPGLAHNAAYFSKWLKGELLAYFVGIGIWMLGTVWLVVRLIDKFF